jgi:hypothetical protein
MALTVGSPKGPVGRKAWGGVVPAIAIQVAFSMDFCS